MEKGEFELAQILLFPILKLVLSQPLFLISTPPSAIVDIFLSKSLNGFLPAITDALCGFDSSLGGKYACAILPLPSRFALSPSPSSDAFLLPNNAPHPVLSY